MKQIIARIRNDLNALESELNQERSVRPDNIHDPALQDEKEAHAETKRKLDVTTVQLRELQSRRPVQPDVINEAPEIDTDSLVRAETGKRDVEIKQLKREVESLQKQRVESRAEIGRLETELKQSDDRFQKIAKELLGYRKANYPAVIERLESEIKKLKDESEVMYNTIREQRILIDKMEARK